MPENRKKKRFLILPEYPGGSKALREFIAANLKYPDAALESRAEGSVIVGYEVDDNGDVGNIRVLKGLGHGCDEEAVRIIGLLRFNKVHNIGRRVRVTKKTKINFRLPAAQNSVKITYHTMQSPSRKTASQKEPGKPVTYHYSIDL